MKARARCVTILLAAVVVLAGCEEQKRAGPAPAGGDPAVGRQIYLAQCAMCHATDPSQRGPVGPPVKGASKALLEARIRRADYPPGYAPKQNTRVMQPMPQAEPHIDDLAAYLR